MGDLDGDGKEELVQMRNYLSEGGTDSVWRLAYEWTGSGIGNSVQLAGGSWVNERFLTVAVAENLPEPATLALLAIGSAALLRRRRS